MTPSRILRAFAALSVVLASASASAQSDSANTWASTPTESEPAAAEEQQDDRGPRDHTYSLGLTLGSSRIRSQDGNRMGALGPGLTVNYTVGRTFGFALRASVWFPMHGRQSDETTSGGISLIDMYDAQRLSFDTSFMFYYRMRPTDALDIVFGAGIHVHTFRLVDSVAGGAQHDPIEIIQGGFGGVVRAERRLSEHFFMSGELALAIDPLDFIKHENRAVFVAPIALTFAVGARR